MTRPPPRSTRTDTLFPSPTLFRSLRAHDCLAATGLGRDDNQRRQAGYLVKLPCDRRAFLDILEADRAGVLGHDRPRQRIPIGQTLPRLDDIAIAHDNRGAVRHLVAFALAAAVVVNGDFARTRKDRKSTRLNSSH